MRLGRRCGLERELVAGFSIVCVGLIGYLSFFIYYLSVAAGTTLSFVLFAIVLASIPGALAERRECPPGYSSVWVATALFGFTYLAFLYLFVDRVYPDLAANQHFEIPRPHDQRIPMMFAEAIYDRIPSRTGKDIWGWYFSDRPPLQAGLTLLFSPTWALFDRSTAYQALATALQTSSLPAAWLLCRSLGFRPRESFLAVIAAGGSGFMYYNCAYPWPKLLAATFVLIAMAPLLDAFLRKDRLSASAMLVSAAAAALAMLSHGGAVYTLVPLALMLSLRFRAMMDLRSIGLGIAVMAVLYAPWTAYGQFVDPNTGRLFKWHLTGGDNESPAPFREMLVSSYRNLTFEQWLSARVANFKVQFGSERIDALTVQIARGVWNATRRPPIDPSHLPSVNGAKLRYDVISLGTMLRIDQRDFAVRALALMNLAWPCLVLLVLRRRRQAPGLDDPLKFLLLLEVVTSIWWCTAQFHGGSTMIVQSSFAMILIAFICATIILCRVSDFWARAICAANASWTLIVWGSIKPPVVEPWGRVNSVAFVASIVGVVALIAWVRKYCPAGDSEEGRVALTQA
jgi:hypothetical protein